MKWATAALGEVCEVVSGATPKTGNPAFWDGDVLWVTPKDLSDNGQKYLSDTPRKITQEGLKSCSAKMLPPESVLFSSRAPIGLIAINRIPVCTNQGFKSMVPRDGILSPDYLYWWLDIHKEDVQRLGRGATFKEVSKKIVEGIQIPLPPLAEQKRIAAILDAADGMRAKRRESLAQLDTLLQSTFLDMFGDLKKNRLNWPAVAIGSLVQEARGGASLKPDDFQDEGFPVLHKGAIKPQGRVVLDDGKKTYASYEYADSKPSSIVGREFTAVTLRDLVPTGPSIGLAANLERAPLSKYLLAQGAYGFRLDRNRVLPDYFVALSNDPGFRTILKRFSVGSTQIHIRTPIYQNIEIPLPSLDLQHRFATIVESVEQQKARLREHLAELDTLFASLQQRAFNGEL